MKPTWLTPRLIGEVLFFCGCWWLCSACTPLAVSGSVGLGLGGVSLTVSLTPPAPTTMPASR